MSSCFLVFGISGVGKSTACKAFVTKHPNFRYLSASTLLSEASDQSPEALRTSSNDIIQQNQNLLVAAFGKFRQLSPDVDVILDAHAVIDNDQGLFRVPLSVIRQLEPDALILLEAPADAIHIRRRMGDRSRPIREVAQIEVERAQERSAVTQYARELRIPLEIDQVGENYELDDAFKRLSRLITLRERP
jgi:adenylate kinase